MVTSPYNVRCNVGQAGKPFKLLRPPQRQSCLSVTKRSMLSLRQKTSVSRTGLYSLKKLQSVGTARAPQEQAYISKDGEFAGTSPRSVKIRYTCLSDRICSSLVNMDTSLVATPRPSESSTKQLLTFTHNQAVVLRVQTRDGQARISVSATDTLAVVAQKIQEAMPNIKEFKLSRDPAHKGTIINFPSRICHS
jgi:hypothetical protein